MSTQRTIKFRAWHSGEACMIDWDFIIDDGILPYFSSDSYTLMQYTGLKDKQGREIYEGDIIEAYGRKATVLYADIRAMYIAHDTWNEALVNVANACSVIGNIYKNPELLNQ